MIQRVKKIIVLLLLVAVFPLHVVPQDINQLSDELERLGRQLYSLSPELYQKATDEYQSIKTIEPSGGRFGLGNNSEWAESVKQKVKKGIIIAKKYITIAQNQRRNAQNSQGTPNQEGANQNEDLLKESGIQTTGFDPVEYALNEGQGIMTEQMNNDYTLLKGGGDTKNDFELKQVDEEKLINIDKPVTLMGSTPLTAEDAERQRLIANSGASYIRHYNDGLKEDPAPENVLDISTTKEYKAIDKILDEISGYRVGTIPAFTGKTMLSLTSNTFAYLGEATLTDNHSADDLVTANPVKLIVNNTIHDMKKELVSNMMDKGVETIGEHITGNVKESGEMFVAHVNDVLIEKQKEKDIKTSVKLTSEQVVGITRKAGEMTDDFMDYNKKVKNAWGIFQDQNDEEEP
jgi:hypothetical protein